MTVILDTGPFVAFLSADDAHHARARALMTRIAAGEYGTVVSTDFVLAEGLAHLRRRPGRRDVSERFAAMFGAGPRPAAGFQVRVRSTDASILAEAVELHFHEYDRGLSLTDCTLAVHATRLAGVVATFDRSFAGLVPVVSE